MTIALVREVSPNVDGCELTHLAREPIDVRLARAQHAAYAAVLKRLGCTVVELEPLPGMPDSVFVEDTAVVVAEVAVMTRPGAASRRGEVASTAAVLGCFRRLAYITEPGTLDGGDVLVAGRRVFVGRSSRSNESGIQQLGDVLGPFGYEVRSIDVHGCLHLKSAVTEVAEGLLLANPSWVDLAALAPATIVEVHPSEPFAANALRVGPKAVHGAAYPRTRRRLEEAIGAVEVADLSELAKAEGALTCCSILVR